MSGSNLGTINFMAPEQARGDNRITPAADLYSVGTTLYAAITGRYYLPFRAVKNDMDYETMAYNFRLVRDREPDKPRRYNPYVTPALEAIVMKCLQKNSVDRYQDAEEVSRDLRRVRTQLENERDRTYREAEAALTVAKWGQALKLYDKVLAIDENYGEAAAHRAMADKWLGPGPDEKEAEPLRPTDTTRTGKPPVVPPIIKDKPPTRIEPVFGANDSMAGVGAVLEAQPVEKSRDLGPFELVPPPVVVGGNGANGGFADGTGGSDWEPNIVVWGKGEPKPARRFPLWLAILLLVILLAVAGLIAFLVFSPASTVRPSPTATVQAAVSTPLSVAIAVEPTVTVTPQPTVSSTVAATATATTEAATATVAPTVTATPTAEPSPTPGLSKPFFADPLVTIGDFPNQRPGQARTFFYVNDTIYLYGKINPQDAIAASPQVTVEIYLLNANGQLDPTPYRTRTEPVVDNNYVLAQLPNAQPGQYGVIVRFAGQPVNPQDLVHYTVLALPPTATATVAPRPTSRPVVPTPTALPTSVFPTTVAATTNPPVTTAPPTLRPPTTAPTTQPAQTTPPPTK